jgi:hypothetical protein
VSRLTLCGVFAVAVSVFFASVQANPLFQAGYLSYDVGRGPNSVAIGDLNRDGHPDLAVSDRESRSVSILLGDGMGGFSTRTDYAMGTNPSNVALGDLNADGRLDLVVALGYSMVAVLLGNGDGTFGATQEFQTGGGPAFVALGDVNGDGRLDFVTANAGGNGNTVSVLHGRGDGFIVRHIEFVTGERPLGVAIGDLNGDGRPDLAVANSFTQAISVHLGNGDGTFGARTDFSTRGFANFVAIGDLNGDGRPDLVATNHDYAGRVAVLLGHGDGTFGTETDYGTGNSPCYVVIGDLNADARPDLAVAGGGVVSVLLGHGNGTFGTKTDFRAGPVSVAIGDMNGDGRADLAVANYGFDTVGVLLGNGIGHFGSGNAFETGQDPSSVAIADVNGDAFPDVAVANSGSNTVSVLIGKGNGTFRTKTDFQTGLEPNSVAIGDLNGDRRPDLAVTNLRSNTVSVLFGNGNGTFASHIDCATGPEPNSVAIGDLDLDGHLDLAVANGSETSILLGTISVLLGNANGTVGPRCDLFAGAAPRSVAIGSLNGDTWPDLVVANTGGLFGASGSAASVLFGRGGGAFAGWDYVSMDSVPTGVAIGDLNEDGRQDLAVTVAGFGGKVSVRLGNGDGGFGVRNDFAAPPEPRSIVTGDLNGDGHLDAALVNGSAVSVLLGNGNGTFGKKTDYATGFPPSAVAIADVNGDQRLDLVVTNRDGGTVWVLLNLGPTTAVFLSSFALVRGDHEIEVRWTLSGHARATDFRLTASRSGSDQWEVPLERQEGSVFVAADRATQLAAGGVIRYTLLHRDPGAGWAVLAAQTLSLDEPRITRLLAPYPNPANPRVVIPFVLAHAQRVGVTVLDTSGRVVVRIDGGEFGAGTGQLVWPGTDARGRPVASGMYAVQLVTRDGVQSRKIVVAK